MLTRLREEDGFSLMEMLVSTALLVIVLAALLGAFEGFSRSTASSNSQSDVQDGLRTAADRIERELRNAGGPPQSPGSTEKTPAIERVSAAELVFDRVDPLAPGSGSNTAGVQRIRVCLNQTNPQREVLWRQVQSWTSSTRPSLPTAPACPDIAYGSQSVLADYLVNNNGQVRPVFTYDSTDPATVTSIDMELFADRDPSHPPKEQRLRTGVYLRNQNRAPTASFTATASGNRHVLLNGTASSDPDADLLSFTWYDVSASSTMPIGSGAKLDYIAPSSGSRTFKLTVSDPSGLTSTAPEQTVNVQ